MEKLTFVLALIFAGARLAFAQDATPQDIVSDPAQLAPFAVPFVIYAVRLAVKYLIPDALIVEIRDKWVPLLAPIIGILVDSAASGQVQWGQGAWVGLAGVGLHQLAKETGIIAKKTDSPTGGPAGPGA